VGFVSDPLGCEFGDRIARPAPPGRYNEVTTIPRAKSTPRPKAAPAPGLLDCIEQALDDGKAEDVVVIDLQGKTSIADHMVIATGRSQRQVSALAERVLTAIRERGHRPGGSEGMRQGDWVLIDAGDVIVHLFRPEVRTFYNLEKMWGAALDEAGASG
jgi:ribosome-associated protein